MDEQGKSNALIPAEQRPLPAVTKPSYWSKVSRIYTLISRGLIVAIPLFVVIFMTLCSGAFTYESVFCFIKDLQSAGSFVPSDHRTVSYTYEETTGPVLSFRGGIAAVNGGGIEIYSPSGEKLLEQSDTLTAPRAVASRKYLVAYDFGGREFMVTNTYAALHKGSTDHPIYMAAVDDTGQIALLTTSEEHLSCVLLYNNNFELIQRFNKASATVGIALSDNGKYVAILGLVSEESTPVSVLEVYRVGATEPTFTARLEGEMPLALDFTDSRHLTVLTDKAVRSCNMDGKWRHSVSLGGATPLRMECSENGVMLALLNDALTAENRILVLDKKGNMCCDITLTGDITAISLAKERAFVLTKGEVAVIDVDDGTLQYLTCEVGATDLFALDDERLRVIYRGEAVYLYFNAEERQ